MINRPIVDFRSILRSMTHPKSKKYRINKDLGEMIQERTKHRAFHPNGPQKILSLSPAVFAVMRTSPEGDQLVVTLTNVTRSRCRVEIPLRDVGGLKGPWRDLLSEKEFTAKKDLSPSPFSHTTCYGSSRHSAKNEKWLSPRNRRCHQYLICVWTITRVKRALFKLPEANYGESSTVRNSILL